MINDEVRQAWMQFCLEFSKYDAARQLSLTRVQQSLMYAEWEDAKFTFELVIWKNYGRHRFINWDEDGICCVYEREQTYAKGLKSVKRTHPGKVLFTLYSDNPLCLT